MTSTKNVQELTVTQNMFGKIFNYGTVNLYNPVLRQRFWLRGIAQPVKYCPLIEKHIRHIAGQGGQSPVIIARERV